MLKVKDYEIQWEHSYCVTNKYPIKAGTVCRLQGDRGVETSAEALCSKKDNFCKDTGRKISLSRAMQKAELPKKERTLIWEAYRNMTEKPRW